MYDFITALITNLFRTYLLKRFMGVFFPQAPENKVKEKVFYALFFITTIGVYMLFHYPPANITSNLVMMYLVACLHKGEQKKKIVVTFLIYGINMFCDVLSMYSFSNYQVGGDYNLIAAYVTVLFIAICEFVLERTMKKREQVNFAPPYWYLILLVPIISIGMLQTLILNNLNNRKILIIVSACVLIINLLIFYLYNALVDTYRKIEENAAYEMQSASYAKQLDILMQSEKKVSALRHDMKHHLNELYSLSKKNFNEEAMEYISEMRDYMQNEEELVRSGNKEIDSILNYMFNRARHELDRVEHKINVPQGVALKSFDTTVIFGNLLENAIEAARQCTGEKWLSVHVQYEKGILFANIKNNYAAVKKKDSRYLTTKQGKGHGIGLQNVERAIEKYQGSMEISDANQVFEVRLLLYVSMNNE